jgi:hypothetical protein
MLATIYRCQDWLLSRILLSSHGLQAPTQSDMGIKLPYGPALAWGMGMVFLKGI